MTKGQPFLITHPLTSISHSPTTYSITLNSLRFHPNPSTPLGSSSLHCTSLLFPSLSCTLLHFTLTFTPPSPFFFPGFHITPLISPSLPKILQCSQHLPFLLPFPQSSVLCLNFPSLSNSSSLSHPPQHSKSLTQTHYP